MINEMSQISHELHYIIKDYENMDCTAVHQETPPSFWGIFSNTFFNHFCRFEDAGGTQGSGSNMAGLSNDAALLRLWRRFGQAGARRFEVPHWNGARRLGWLALGVT